MMLGIMNYQSIDIMIGSKVPQQIYYGLYHNKPQYFFTWEIGMVQIQLPFTKGFPTLAGISICHIQVLAVMVGVGRSGHHITPLYDAQRERGGNTSIYWQVALYGH